MIEFDLVDGDTITLGKIANESCFVFKRKTANGILLKYPDVDAFEVLYMPSEKEVYVKKKKLLGAKDIPKKKVEKFIKDLEFALTDPNSNWRWYCVAGDLFYTPVAWHSPYDEKVHLVEIGDQEPSWVEPSEGCIELPVRYLINTPGGLDGSGAEEVREIREIVKGLKIAYNIK